MNRRSLLAFTLCMGATQVWAAQGKPRLFDGTEISDWSKFWDAMTFDRLPPVATAGNLSGFNFAGQRDAVIATLGYDPTVNITITPGQLPGNILRSWGAGTPTAQIIQLGDLQGVFIQPLEQYTLNTIASMAGQSLDALLLASFPTVQWQSIGDLVKAIPSLGLLPPLDLESVAKPIFDLINQTFPEGLMFSTLQEALDNVFGLSDQVLSQLTNIKEYALKSIQGLVDTALNQFKGWGQSLVKDIPFLQGLPWSQFGIAGTMRFGPTLAMVDLVLTSNKEKFSGRKTSTSAGFAKNTITGGAVSGWKQTCSEAACPHVELAGAAGLTGKRIVSGLSQSVGGGRGMLAGVNGGKEPTGFEPWELGGGLFKLALTHGARDEATNTVQISMYFALRFYWFGVHETPKCIGPIPLFTVKAGQYMPVPGYAMDPT